MSTAMSLEAAFRSAARFRTAVCQGERQCEDAAIVALDTWSTVMSLGGGAAGSAREPGVWRAARRARLVAGLGPAAPQHELTMAARRRVVRGTTWLRATSRAPDAHPPHDDRITEPRPEDER